MGGIIISLLVQREMTNEDWNSQEGLIEDVEIGGIQTVGMGEKMFEEKEIA